MTTTFAPPVPETSPARPDRARPRRVALVWVVVGLLGALCSGLVFGQFDDDGGAGLGTEADRADVALERLRPAAGQAFALPDVPDPALAVDLRALDGVAAVTPLGDGGALRVDMTTGLSDDARTDVAEAVEDRVEGPVLAEELVDRDFDTVLGEDLPRAEVVGLGLALVVLVLALGVRAAAVPLLTGVATILGAMPPLLLAALLVPVMSHALNIVTLLGLGLALDYGLLLLARYRQARADGVAHDEAVELARTRAGRTVLWSAATVVVTLSTLLVFRDGPFTAVAIGGTAATLVAVLASRTLAPAMLQAWGERMRPARPRTRESRFSRVAGAVQRRPGPVVVVSALLLAALALPLAGARLVEGDLTMLPADSPSRQAAEALEQRVPGFGGAEVDVVAPDPQAMQQLVPALRAVPDVGEVEVEGAAAVLRVPGHPEGEQATAVVDRVRALVPDGVLVGGDAAFRVDHLDQLAHRLPVVLVLLTLLTGLLVLGLTRSVRQAVVAPALALLSQGATLGVLALLYGDGLVVYSPIIAAALSFALSLDYLIFLLHRAREDRAAGAGTTASVREALGSTGQVITLAALIFSGVSLGFATSRIDLTEQLGVALVVGVLLDATLVRCLLLPAALAWRPLASHREQPRPFAAAA